MTPPGVSLAMPVPKKYALPSSIASRSSRIAACSGPGRRRRQVMPAEMWSCRLRPTPRSGTAGAMPCAAQVVGVADPRQHQQLRRVDDAAGEDHLALGAGHRGVAAAAIFDPDRAAALEHDPGRQRAGLDREPGARQGRPQIGHRRAAPPSVADRLLAAGEAFLAGAVVVVGCRVPGRRAGRREGLDQRIGEMRALRRQRAAARRDIRWRPLPSFPGAGNRAAHGHRTSCRGRPPPSGRNRRGCRAHRPSR